MAWVRASMPLSAVTRGGHGTVSSGSTTATRGRTAWINHADAVFDSFEIYVEEIIDVGDQLVVVTHERATGKAAGFRSISV